MTSLRASRVCMHAALAPIAAAVAMGALAALSPFTAVAAPGGQSSSPPCASQPVNSQPPSGQPCAAGGQVPVGDVGLFDSRPPASPPVTVIQSGPIEVKEGPTITGSVPDVKAPASPKAPSSLPPGTVLDPNSLTKDNAPMPQPKVCTAQQGPLDPRPRWDQAPHDAMHSLPDIVERNFFNRGAGDDFLGTNGPPPPVCK